MEQNQESKTAELVQFVPDNLSVDAESYLKLVIEKILGRDKQGALRPMSDVKLFLYQCKRIGLDPLARQVYAVYRWNSQLGKEAMTIQTSIDGYRLIAERSKLFGGSDDPVYEEKEGSKYPLKASCTVYKLNQFTGERMPITASARWDEYAQVDKSGNPIQMWARMPYLMLGKVAEALALRRAFPQDLAGIYTDEEMEQADNESRLKLPQPTKEVVAKKEVSAAIKDVETTRSKLNHHEPAKGK